LFFRPAANASRAGTAGFRPPEVLLRYPAQTTGKYKIDIVTTCLKEQEP